MARPKKGDDDRLLLALACGATPEAAAHSLGGISARTVYRRLQDPDFCRRLQQLRSDMVQRTAAMLTAAGPESVRTLVALQKDSIPPATRLGAARAALEIGRRAREAAELEQRLAALEAALQAAQAQHGAGAHGSYS